MCDNMWGSIKLWSVLLCSFESPVDMTTYLDHNLFSICILWHLPFSLSMDATYLVCFVELTLFPLSLPPHLTCPCDLSHSSILPLSPQVDSMDNFTPSNTPSREDDPKSHLKSRSRSPSMASDVEPIEVRQSLSLGKKQVFLYRGCDPSTF